jgi:tetratricopeptide (TPR) repeat protein
MSDFASVPTPPPRHARSFRKTGKWLILATAFFTPFFFLPTTDDPIGINKFMLVGCLTAAALICFLGCVLEERRVDYPRSLMALFLLVFLGVQGLSTWLSILPGQSFWGNLSAPDSFLSILLYIFIFFLTFFFFRENDLTLILGAMGAGLFLALILTFFADPVGSAVGWGILMAAVIAALAVVRPGELPREEKIYFWLACVVALVALVALNDQSLWLTLAAFIVVLAALRFGPRAHFQYAFGLIVVALFFAFVSPRLPMSPQLAENSRPTISESIAATQGSLAGGSVLTGTGPSTFNLDFALFKPSSINNTSIWSDPFSEGHDFAITLLATGGLLSFLVFLWLAILIWYPFLHVQLLNTKLAMAVSAAAFLTVALFLYPGFFAGFVILFALLGLIAGSRARGVLSFADWSGLRSFGMSIALIILAAAVLAATFFAGEKYVAAVFFEQSNAAVAAGDSATAFSKVNEAITLDPQDAYYRGASNILVDEAKTLAAANDPTASVELPVVVENAVQAAESATNQDSRDPANWGNLGSVYEAVMPIVNGADVSAEDSYTQAASLDPVNPQWDVAIARVYIESASLLPSNSPTSSAEQQSDWSTAEAYLQKAIALKDDYADPRVLLVEIYLDQGNVAEAIQKVEELKEENPLDPGVAFELGYLYYQSGQTSEAEEEFQVAAILDPNYSNARYFLGLLYDAQGMTTQALAEFQAVQLLNPGNSEIATIIANIQAGRPALANNAASSTLSGQEPSVSVKAHP